MGLHDRIVELNSGAVVRAGMNNRYVEIAASKISVSYRACMENQRAYADPIPFSCARERQKKS